MPRIEDEPHPLDLHAHREPMKGAAVLVVAVSAGDDAAAAVVGRGLVKLLEQRGRKTEMVVSSVKDSPWNEALARPLEGRGQPLVIVTTATQTWSLAHLDPLLEGVDSHDHVYGRRPASGFGRIRRRAAVLPWRVLFANPLLDPHSPCRVHRREALEKIELQSKGRFAEIELVAKATYLKQLIDEVKTPKLDAIGVKTSTAPDFRLVWSKPTFLPIKST